MDTTRNCVAVLLFAALSLLVCGSPAQDKKIMLCYWGSWSAYRPMQCAFAVDQIDPFMCTHIVYAFTKILDNKITLFDPWLELPDGGGRDMLRKLNDLRTTNPQLKTIIAIGGWNEGSKNYSDMASTETGRRIFVDSVVAFLNRYRFDGFDLDWEYPTDRGGAPEDYVNYILLLKELKQALGDRYLLSAAVAASPEKVDQAYNVPEMSKYLDIMSVMGYDFFGAWDNKTGHNAPLRARQGASEIETTWNVEYAVNHWISRGANPSKLLLGVPLYGRTFLLEDPENAGFLAPSAGPGPMGPCSRTDGNLGYNEICRYLDEGGWTVTRDPDVNAPVAVKDKVWIGYDDAESLTAKVQFAMLKGLAGIMIWSMETDDFRGACRRGRNPLQTAIQTAMNTPIAPPTTSEAPPVTQEPSTLSEAPQTSQEAQPSTTAEVQTESTMPQTATPTESWTEPKELESTMTTEAQTEPRESEPTTITEAQTESKTFEPTTTTEVQTKPKESEPTTTTEAQTEPKRSEPTTTTESQTEPKTSEPTTTTEAQTEPRESEPTTTTQVKIEPTQSQAATTTEFQTPTEVSQPSTTVEVQTEPTTSQTVMETKPSSKPEVFPPSVMVGERNWPKCDTEGYYVCPWNPRYFSRCVDMGYRNYLRFHYKCPINTIFNPAFTACSHPYQKKYL